MTVNYKSAYTLIELSISLTIIAVLLTIGLGVIGKQNLNEKITITNTNMAYIEKAIYDFYRQNGYMPCPAQGNTLESNANFGTSTGYNGATNECDGGVLTSATGMVPVRSIMIPDEYAYDGWGRKFTYRVAKGLGSNSTFTNTLYNGDIKVVDLAGQELTNTYSAYPYNFGAAYVLISHGADGSNAAWHKNDITNPTGAAGIEAENTNHSINKIYIQNTPTINFDDVVAYKLKSYFQIVKSGASPLLIPKKTCANAGIIANNNVTSNATISAALANQINASASAVNTLCQAPPTICSFKPTSLSGLALWYDGSDPNGDGSTVLNGTLIGTWIDKSGGGHHASQPVAGLKPTYKTVNNFPKAGLSFTAGGTAMTFALNSVIANIDFTIIMSGTIATYGGQLAASSAGCGNNTGVTWQYGSGIGAANLINLFTYSNVNNDVSMYIEQQDVLNVPSIFASSLNMVSTGHHNYGYNLYFYNKNGLALWGRRSESVTNNPMSCLNTISIQPGLNGFLGEVIIYNRALNDVELSKITEYLSNRWFSGVCG